MLPYEHLFLLFVKKHESAKLWPLHAWKYATTLSFFSGIRQPVLPKTKTLPGTAIKPNMTFIAMSIPDSYNSILQLPQKGHKKARNQAEISYHQHTFSESALVISFLKFKVSCGLLLHVTVRFFLCVLQRFSNGVILNLSLFLTILGDCFLESESGLADWVHGSPPLFTIGKTMV